MTVMPAACRLVRGTIALVMLVSAIAAFAAGESPFDPADGYGFDWLQPDAAVCQRVEPSIVSSGRCEYAAAGGFTGDVASLRCRVSSDSEWLVFADEATCRTQLETMQANAP
jgi:hypothetical protein